MNADEIIELSKRHTVWSWSAGNNVAPLPVVKAEGLYFYTADGKKLLDWNSQLMSVLIGHSHPKVIARMKEALDGVLFAAPSMATEPRARLGKKLAELVPGNINSFFFTLGGAEANENAIKAARLYTGRNKILSSYRSYHGATHGAQMLTGDPRRLPNEPGAPGFIKFMPPVPYQYGFGETEEEITRNHLTYLSELIDYEGGNNIAAVFIESMTGTNGILLPPKGWMKGLKALCERHGILLVCDEVMAGWGRTGKLFAFEHGDIVPDMVTMAKGLTSSYVPLGALGVSDPIAEHFRKNVFYGGLTYNAHAFAMATAEAVIDVTIEERLVENAAKMGEVMTAEMEKLAAKHKSVRTHRNVGLFGIVELQKDTKGTPLAGYNQNHPVMGKFLKACLDDGLWTISHWNAFMCNPPLTVDAETIRWAFGVLDRNLGIVDEIVEG